MRKIIDFFFFNFGNAKMSPDDKSELKGGCNFVDFVELQNHLFFFTSALILTRDILCQNETKMC